MRFSYSGTIVELTFNEDRLVPGDSTKVTISITSGQEQHWIEKLTMLVTPRAQTKNGVSIAFEENHSLITDLTVNRGEYISIDTTVDVRNGIPGTLGALDVFAHLRVTMDSEIKSVQNHLNIPISRHEEYVVQSAAGEGLNLIDVDRVVTHRTTPSTYFHLYEFGRDLVPPETDRVTVIVCTDPQYPIAWVAKGRRIPNNLEGQLDQGTELHSISEARNVVRRATKSLSN